jgi:hypothetical protein
MNVREIPARDIAAIVSEPWVDTSRKPWISGNIAYSLSGTDIPLPQHCRREEEKGEGIRRLDQLSPFMGKNPGLMSYLK